jgi:4-hydroxybenzoate polyprenyltransferase
MSAPIASPSGVESTSPRLNGWLQLLRLPNLFTVPGDTLAGLFLGGLASGSYPLPSLFLPVAISFSGVLLYCAGLLYNDYFDQETDLRERPSRPIPGGRVPPGQVLKAGHLLNLGGIVLAFVVGVLPGIIATMLATAAAFYNLSFKRIPLLGPLNMGLCRGLLLLLGASVLSAPVLLSPPVLLSAASQTLFVAFVSRMAARETERYGSGPIRWMPGIVLLLWFIGIRTIALPAESNGPLFMLVSGAAAGWAIHAGYLLKQGLAPAGIQRCIGRFLRGLLLIQAAVVAFGGGPVVLVLLLAGLLPLTGILGKRYYSS